MNIFENYKTTKYFVETINDMNYEDRTDFTNLVKRKFHEKVTSDEELESYMITIQDLELLATAFFKDKE